MSGPRTLSIPELDQAIAQTTSESLFSCISGDDELIDAFWRGEPIEILLPGIGKVSVSIQAEIVA